MRRQLNVVQLGLQKTVRLETDDPLQPLLASSGVDGRGVRWVRLKDVHRIIGVPMDDTVAPSEFVYPVVFRFEGESKPVPRAAVMVSHLNRYFDSIDYRGPFARRLEYRINSWWNQFFEMSDRNTSPLRAAYQYTLNEVLEPTAREYFALAEKELGYDIDHIEFYEFLYGELLACIGNDAHVDFTDLSAIELVHMTSAIGQFTLMLQGYMVEGYEFDILSYPKAILLHLRDVYGKVGGTTDHWRDVLECKMDGFKLIEEGCP